MTRLGNIVLRPNSLRPIAIRNFCDFNWNKVMESVLGESEQYVRIEFPGIEDPLYYNFTTESRIPNLLVNGIIVYGPIMIVRFEYGDKGKYPVNIPVSTLSKYRKLLIPCMFENEYRKKRKKEGKGKTADPEKVRKEW